MRDLIVQETLKLVKQRGIRGLTMDDLAASLGISKKTLYKHYRSKQELISELVDEMLDLEKELSQQEVSKYTSWHDRLSALLSVYCSNDIPFRVIDELYRYYPREREKIERMAGYRERLILALLQEGIVRKEIRQDVDPAALIFVLNKLFISPTDEKFLLEHRLTVNSLMQQLKTLFFHGILNRSP